MTYRDLHPAELAELCNDPELVILDMRDAASQARGRLDGAQTPTEAMLKQLMRRRPRTAPILVYCYHGNSSRDLCQFIAGFGHERVYNLAGGWAAWVQHLAASGSPGLPEDAKPEAALVDWARQWGFSGPLAHARLDNGMTPLMLAALKGEPAHVENLLALGADPNHVNEDDHHALWFACVHGSPALVSRLIDAGARVDNQNVNGATCAIYAASTGKLEVLRCLVEAGANLALETSGGYNALESAATRPVLKYLRGRCAERV